MSTQTVGILALQGDFEAHARMLDSLGATSRLVRVPADLGGLDALVLPGGESTTMTLGIERERLAEPLRERNAFGRQVRSFEGDVALDGFAEPFHAVFIRAPLVAEHGPEVEVLAAVDGDPVAVRQGAIVALSFHPELYGETRFHQQLLDQTGVERA